MKATGRSVAYVDGCCERHRPGWRRQWHKRVRQRERRAWQRAAW